MAESRHIGRLIGKLSNQIRRQIDFTGSTEDVTPVQGKILHFLLSSSPERDLFQKDIEGEFNLRGATATGIIKLMERNELITRESVPYDARLKKIIVTDKGEKLREQVYENMKVLESKLTKNISTEDLDLFYKVIDQMYENLQ